MKNVNCWQIFFLILLTFGVFGNQTAEAAPLRTTYQAKIIKPDGLPLQETAVNFRFTILDPTATCILYIEDYTAMNMNDSGGVISFSLGAGTRSFPSSGTAATFSQVFDNSTPAYSCKTAGTYNPLSTDIRRIVMQFEDSSGWQSLPAMTINAVPFAWYAVSSDEAKTLNGKADSDFVQQSAIPTCSAGQALHFNGASFNCVSTTTSGSVVSALGFVPATGASVTTLSSDLTAVSSSVFSVTTSFNNFVNTVAASFTALPVAPWSASGTKVYYTSGNVGIGVSNPSALLTVNNSIDNSGTTFYNDMNHWLFIANNRNNPDPYMTKAGLTIDAHTGELGYMYVLAEANLHPKLILGTRDNSFGARDHLFIDNTGFVGIGVSTPAYTLSVSGNINLNTNAGYIRTVNASGTNGRILGLTATNILRVGDNDNIASQTVFAGNGAENTVNMVDDDGMRFGTSFVERMRITSAGAIGIGIANPSFPFEIKNSNFGGQLNAQFYTAGAYSGISFKTDNIAGIFHKRSWTIANMNDFGGRTGLEFAEYVDNDGDDELCEPGETCMPRMVIASGGAVGIGTLNPSYKLDVSGTIRGYGITDSSDIRLKNTIEPLNFSLEKLLKIQGVSYYWNDKSMPKKQIGFIAQQLEKIYPELVETDKEGFKSVNYSHLVAPLVEGFKSMYNRVTKNERKISSIESENAQLKQENAAIKSYLCEKDPNAPICQK